MPYKEVKFITGGFYHLILRAIDNNLLFKNTDDYYRGVFSIYEFNNASPVSIRNRRKARAAFKTAYRGRDSVSTEGLVIEPDKRDKLVEVMSFCLMPNHVHLLARQIKDGGIIKFMSKIGGGYGGYFNRKYKRKGYVFQDRFERVLIKNDNQLRIVFVYIHANPLSLIEPGWKELGIKNPEKAQSFLEKKYKWFSYPDFIGGKSFPSVTDRDFLLDVMGGEERCKNAENDWIYHKAKIAKFSDIFLDF
ncbi:MAG: transposase [Patescibacteria group bacterium]